MFTRRIGAPALGIVALACSVFSLASANPIPAEEALKQRLASYLDGGMQAQAVSRGQPLSPIRSYPLLATTAYLLFENDPSSLTRYYPAISQSVMRLFDPSNVAGTGIIRGMPGSGQAGAVSFSPGLNALACIELYSLHLIAWKTGLYEDALEDLSWSNTLADAVTRSFYDPSRRCFYPLDDGGRFITTYGAGQILPLVMDRLLGSSMHERVATDYRLRSVSQPVSRQGSPAVDEPWDNPLMRPVMLDLLPAAIPADGDLYQTLRASAGSSVPPAGDRQAVWIDYWRGNRFVADRLFPPWRPISSLVNLTLLFERDRIATPKELAGLRGGIDSLVTALSVETLDLGSYRAAMLTANRLLSRATRLSELIDSSKDRWRVIDDAAWARLSPRAKRLVKETLGAVPADLERAKADLAVRLERGSGISFRLALPERPVPAGRPIEFTSSLRVVRDTVIASQVYVQIGENRWKTMDLSRMVTLAPGGDPFFYEGTLTLPPALEPGIVTLPSSVDFVYEGRQVEIHRIESVSLAKECDVAIDLPEGRLIGRKPVPLAITLAYRPDRDVQGTVDGTFYREFVTVPSLPARFVARAGTERTELDLTVAPTDAISPGRYPFSLTVTLDGKPVASLDEMLVRPFQWLHLGTLPRAEDALRNGVAYQTDLLKTYSGPDATPLKWREVPDAAVDADGALWPQRLYGSVRDRSALFYTVVDAPARVKLVWRLATNDEASMWMNGEPLVAAGAGPLREARGDVELRKGTNSFLIATHWSNAPDRIEFELEDENGLPATGLGNELDALVEGYERLTAPETPGRREGPPTELLTDVTVRYTNAAATEVSIIGSFNNWEPGTTPMRKEGKGVWTAVLHLRPGTYPYKFLVNHKQRIVDPANPATEPDGFGGTNSILKVR